MFDRNERARLIVLFMLALFFLMQLAFVLPASSIAGTVLPLVKPVLSILGLSEKWNMFAPEVRKVNLDGQAVIVFADGSLEVAELPRFDQLDDRNLSTSFARFSKEKLRKLYIDRLPAPGFEPFLEDIARSVAREKSKGSLANRPVSVTLSVNWAAIEAPDEMRGQAVFGKHGFPPHTERRTLLVYRLKPEDRR